MAARSRLLSPRLTSFQTSMYTRMSKNGVFFRFLLLLSGWRHTLGFLHRKSEKILVEKTHHIRHDVHVNDIITRPFLFNLILFLQINYIKHDENFVKRLRHYVMFYDGVIHKWSIRK